MAVSFIDASDWLEHEWVNTGGTRAKRVLQSPEGEEWFFKRSEKKPAKDHKPEKYYRYEFWSEIIAHQLGDVLGLNVLQYDIAIHGGDIGCISPLMINREKEQLIEVGRYMTSLNIAFLPENNTTRHEYTFQLLEQTIDEYNLAEYWPNFFETILFDAIIGNTDRHQENWAFVAKNTFNTLKDLSLKKLRKVDVQDRSAYNRYLSNQLSESNPGRQETLLQMTNILGMAPVYDCGSSLGRELTDERVNYLLQNEDALAKYINRGKSELHWRKDKITHFQLVENLLNSPYIEKLISASSFLNNWDDATIRNLLNNVDESVPSAWHMYCIPNSRKELIIKVLTLRTKILRQLLDGGIR